MPLSFKLVGGGLLLLFVGFIMSVKELRLSFSGKVTQAKIIDAGAWVQGGDITSVELQYRFKDDKGKDVNGTCKMGADYRPANLFTVDVIYLPSDPSVNRLAAKRSWAGYIMLMLGAVMTVGGGWYFNHETVQEAHAETARTIKNRSITSRLGLHD